ncbi:MAG TPA: ribose-phosphate pyrophosphokinase, partial [Clostridiaceae bacterium]|nr:ribose-phosphate pyrophosphokinase [Clostridiaceae bacterium]
MKGIKVFNCSAGRQMTEEICQYLGYEPGKIDIFKFDNDNTFVRILETVREYDVYVVQTSMPPVDQNFMELLITIDALKRASAHRITAVMPYFPYSRSDRKDQPRVPITAKLVADLLTTAGANRILTCDLHSPQIQGFFNIPVDQLTARELLCNYFINKGYDDYVVVAPDAGSSKKAYKYARMLNAPIAMLDKRRLGNEQEVTIGSIVGNVKGLRAVIFDDEIDRCSTMMEAVNTLLENGVKEVYIACTHPVFSGPAIERLRNLPVKEVVVTNTIPLTEEKKLDKITVLSMGPLFAETIKRIHKGESVGEIFHG